MPSDSLAGLSIDRSRKNLAGGTFRSRRRLFLLALIVILIAISAFFMLRGRAIMIETTVVSQVFPTQSFTLLNASGYVVAQKKASVAAKTTGRLEWLGVEEGSRVVSGQVIARLENRDLEVLVRQGDAAVQTSKASLDQARAELADADQSFRRQRELLKQGIVSQAEYDSAETRFKRSAAAVAAGEAGVRNSNAALQGAKVNFDYSLIRAPFDGVVLTKNADVGDIITPLGAAASAKAAVVTIADPASLQVEADVSESSLSQVRKGQPCEITLDALPQRRFRGVIHLVVPTADRTKASVMVKVRFVDKDERILPEMSAKVAILSREILPDDQKPRIAVNPLALVKSAGVEGVWLVKGNSVQFTPVKRGAKIGDMLEITGVKPGDKVALKPLDKLKDGLNVKMPEGR